ncbi:beta-ketoacyl-ACP synthase II [Azospirillum picis]|uniref:3-oxoacyl-[acyl-carrier-protein] synthase 2 n=1 Tax=Azospirillum picis TaxID=488438 RepID=A0ABU0MGH7_9PROT|nr:beta-ketoacyl-ACP synthase II [Azospirillum picis]MBP2298617.1 3-oxoacyl-[acyl-carrier-protein] synthase II [Azospirillum picis]MDQ0532334.1 3-oxoacyl-[acyl-carrier-protein] synthase II [Azospirillum picis]
MRRVVVTGLGLVTPLGVGHTLNWERLISSQSGIRAITRFDASDLASKVAGQVPRGTGDGDFDADAFVPPKDQRKMDDFIIFAIAAAHEAIKDSGWAPQTDEERERTGVMVGSGIGGLPGIADGAVTLHEKGPRRLSPFFIPACLINLASGHISIQHGFKGPNHAVVTACSTGAHAIGDAARLIMLDDADVMIAGGTEAAVSRLGVGGFAAMRALSTNFNDTPEKASRPYDKDRDGFVIGEGAGVVVLEELEHARKRGATIYAEVVGYGMSGDAHHISAPAEDGNGGFRAMRNALKRAGLAPSDIDYVNAHGTSTPLGDEIELGAVRRLFGESMDKLAMSSTKSAIGHLLGAAGAVEAIYSIKAINHGVVPPTLNLENPSESCQGANLVPKVAQERRVRAALSNSFGFGGTNASLVFKEFV